MYSQLVGVAKPVPNLSPSGIAMDEATGSKERWSEDPKCKKPGNGSERHQLWECFVAKPKGSIVTRVISGLIKGKSKIERERERDRERS